ncbi:MAG: three-Cys-motif partner protein TcmP [Verrucomicrobia bacterium]|nr:three-Cys-motif partner protein TcmP [Verrucomicrobiota bacterium]
MSNGELYLGREQTLVKHFILQKYLERFACIVGSHWDTLTYVDCFSGPWNARSEEFDDSSFAIALKELRNARDVLARQRGRNIQLRCFFLEKTRAAHAKLKQFADSVTDATIEARNAALEESIPDIVDFVRRGGSQAFPFIFIDPTGWTGFEMETIAPLLRLNPGEALINFMTGHIRRFLDSPDEETQDSFKRLFGSGTFRTKVQGLAQLEREDAAVEEYTRNAKAVGGFRLGCNAIVLHPEMDRTHFNLIYLTRNPKGIEVFKDAEKKAMEVQEAARAEAQQRKRVARKGQAELFGSKELHDSAHYESLRDRYLTKAQDLVLRALQSKTRLLYEDAWTLALSQPMAWESDLKQWIAQWKDEGLLEVVGMQPRQKVPHRNEDNYLIWK